MKENYKKIFDLEEQCFEAFSRDKDIIQPQTQQDFIYFYGKVLNYLLAYAEISNNNELLELKNRYLQLHFHALLPHISQIPHALQYFIELLNFEKTSETPVSLEEISAFLNEDTTSLISGKAMQIKQEILAQSITPITDAIITGASVLVTVGTSTGPLSLPVIASVACSVGSVTAKHAYAAERQNDCEQFYNQLYIDINDEWRKIKQQMNMEVQQHHNHKEKFASLQEKIDRNIYEYYKQELLDYDPQNSEDQACFEEIKKIALEYEVQQNLLPENIRKILENAGYDLRDLCKENVKDYCFLAEMEQSFTNSDVMTVAESPSPQLSSSSQLLMFKPQQSEQLSTDSLVSNISSTSIAIPPENSLSF